MSTMKMLYTVDPNYLRGTRHPALTAADVREIAVPYMPPAPQVAPVQSAAPQSRRIVLSRRPGIRVDARAAMAIHEAGHGAIAMFQGGTVEGCGYSDAQGWRCEYALVPGQGSDPLLLAYARERAVAGVVAERIAGYPRELVDDGTDGCDARTLAMASDQLSAAFPGFTLPDPFLAAEQVLRMPHVWLRVLGIAAAVLEYGWLSGAEVREAAATYAVMPEVVEAVEIMGHAASADRWVG